MSHAVDADGQRVPRGPVDLRSSCPVDAETAIYATQSTWAGDIYSALHFGTEQMTVEVADPPTWHRIAAIATDQGNKMQAALNLLEQEQPAQSDQTAESGEVVELPTSEQRSPEPGG